MKKKLSESLRKMQVLFKIKGRRNKNGGGMLGKELPSKLARKEYVMKFDFLIVVFKFN